MEVVINNFEEFSHSFKNYLALVIFLYLLLVFFGIRIIQSTSISKRKKFTIIGILLFIFSVVSSFWYLKEIPFLVDGDSSRIALEGLSLWKNKSSIFTTGWGSYQGMVFFLQGPFLKIFRRKIVTIFPPVIMRIPDQKVAKQWRGSLGLGGSRIIGFAGRFVEEKGGDILIKSIPYMAEEIGGLKVVFAGEENIIYEDFYKRTKELIDKYKKNIVFLGLVPHQNMPEFYTLCDVLALPSRAECFGMVQVEAMLCGTSVVAFNIPGGRVPILETGMGELAKKDDPCDLAEKILKVINHKKKYFKSREEIERVFNLDNTLNDYEKIFSC